MTPIFEHPKKDKKLEKFCEEKTFKLFSTDSIQVLCIYNVNVQIYVTIQKSQNKNLYELKILF